MSGLAGACSLGGMIFHHRHGRHHGPPHGMDQEFENNFEEDQPQWGRHGRRNLMSENFLALDEIPESGFYALKKQPEGQKRWNKGNRHEPEFIEDDEEESFFGRHHGRRGGRHEGRGEHHEGKDHHGKEGRHGGERNHFEDEEKNEREGHHEGRGHFKGGRRFGKTMKKAAILSLILNTLFFCAALCGYKASKSDSKEVNRKCFKKALIMLVLAIPFAISLGVQKYRISKHFIANSPEFEGKLNQFSHGNEDFGGNRHHGRRELKATNGEDFDFPFHKKGRKNHSSFFDSFKNKSGRNGFDIEELDPETKFGIAKRFMACMIVLKMIIIAAVQGLFVYLFMTYKSAFAQFEQTNAEYIEKIEQNDDQDQEAIYEEISEANEIRRAKVQQATVQVVPEQTQPVLYQYIPPVIAPEAMNNAFVVQAPQKPQETASVYPTLFQAPVAQAPVAQAPARQPEQPQQTYSLEQVKELLALERERNAL